MFVAIVKLEIHGDESSQIYHVSTVPLYCMHILSNATEVKGLAWA